MLAKDLENQFYNSRSNYENGSIKFSHSENNGAEILIGKLELKKSSSITKMILSTI